MDKIQETMEWIMDNGLESCEQCGEFKSGDDLTEGLCTDCHDPEEY